MYEVKYKIGALIKQAPTALQALAKFIHLHGDHEIKSITE